LRNGALFTKLSTILGIKNYREMLLPLVLKHLTLKLADLSVINWDTRKAGQLEHSYSFKKESLFQPKEYFYSDSCPVGPYNVWTKICKTKDDNHMIYHLDTLVEIQHSIPWTHISTNTPSSCPAFGV